ncbi:MAG: hypothetical protein IT577_08900 [Verrucomicrobiae bacterium]|nr:hypothetical protein [Verrucomicrobiae bacterium]
MMKVAVPRCLAMACALAASATAARAQGLDFRGAPDDAARQKYIGAGWKAGRDQLRAALVGSYTAQAVSGAGFADWLALHDWLEVLGREGTEDLARLVRLHLWIAQGDGRPTIMSPGVNGPPKDGAENVPLDTALGVVAGDRFQSELMDRFVPKGAKIPAGPIGDALGTEAVAALTSDAPLGRELFQNVAEGDLMSVALPLLLELRKAAGERWTAYTRLAVAMALVYDRPPPEFWPHHQVGQDKVLRQKSTPVERFNFWVQNNEDRKLILDLKKLTVEQAKFVVDAFVPEDELLWAQKNVRLGRTGFDKAFFMIRYDTPRLKANRLDWIAPDYRLETIKKEGGICVDQAYFAMIAGKANGLPTLFFSGQGASGGHGWFGYMRSDDKWEVDCGRYASQNFSVGNALDPQTWDRISDHELAYLASRFRDKPEFLKSQLHLRMARLFEQASDASGQRAAIENAMAACPQNVAAWDAKTALLAADPNAGRELLAHSTAAAKQFITNDDIKVRYQKTVAAVSRKLGDASAADSIERKIITQQKEERADLTVDTAAGRLKEFVAAKQYEEGYKEFRKLIKKLGETGGGNAFQGVVEPFVESLIAAGETKLAEKSLDLAREELRPERGSLLEMAFGSLEEKAGIKKK